MPPMYFEDFEIGQSFTTKRRTITEADIVNFAGFSGDYNPLHMDETFARTTPFGRRIAHGMGVLSIVTGLSQALGVLEGTIMAFLGLEWSFVGPVFIGDTIHAVQTVAFMRETSKPDRGIITMDSEVVNQNGETVQKGKRTFLMRRRPSPEAGE